MQMVKRPGRLKLMAFLILLLIPFFLINLLILEKGNYQEFLESEKMYWIAIEAAWTLSTFYWVMNAKWRGFWSFVLLSGCILWGNLYFLVQLKNYSLAFFSLFLLILFVLYFNRLYRALKQPYYHSKKRWYEGLPRFLPHIEGTLLTKNGESVSLKLSSLESDGFYGYLDTSAELSMLKQFDQVKLKVGALELDSAVQLVTIGQQKRSGGFRFLSSAEERADHLKNIKDFIDRVRSMGYVG